MKRRDFIIQSSVLTAGSLALLQCKAATLMGMSGSQAGIQLYTVRDFMNMDPKRTLTELAAMGYTHVENAGYNKGLFYKMPAKDFKMILSDLGLKMTSGHMQTGATTPDQTHTMTNMWEAAVADAAEIGQKRIVLAYLHEPERKTLDDYKKIAALLNKNGEIAKKYGIKVGYHNHDFEFKAIDGVLPYDLLLKETDKKLVDFEMDLYWVKFANQDPVAYFKKHKGRFPLWHVKDMDKASDRFFTEVGNGIIDFKELFTHRATAGMEEFYVEQDVCRNHRPLDSAKISVDYMKKNILNQPTVKS
jgi:sugar phosphate isomerase/epimerase